jgi:hypothetical protein
VKGIIIAILIVVLMLWSEGVGGSVFEKSASGIKTCENPNS